MKKFVITPVLNSLSNIAFLPTKNLYVTVCARLKRSFRDELSMALMSGLQSGSLLICQRKKIFK